MVAGAEAKRHPEKNRERGAESPWRLSLLEGTADAYGSGGNKITQSQSRILNDLPVPELQSSFREAWPGGLSGRLFGDTWLSGGDSGQPSFHRELPLHRVNSVVFVLCNPPKSPVKHNSQELALRLAHNEH